MRFCCVDERTLAIKYHPQIHKTIQSKGITANIKIVLTFKNDTNVFVCVRPSETAH